MPQPIETKFIGDEGFELAAREWLVPETVTEKAKILFLHALNEYSGVYDEWFSKFAEEGYHVVAYDQRGHGKSVKTGKMAGVTNELYVFDDLNRVIRQLFTRWSSNKEQESSTEEPEAYKGKFFLLGHGMGASIVLNYLTKGLYRERVDGFIAGSPWIDLGENVFSSWTLKVQVSLVAKVKPKSQFMKKFDWKKLANDDTIIDKIRKDTNLRATYTAGQIHDSIERGQRLKNSLFVKKFVERPLLVTHGTADTVSPISAVEEFYKLVQLPDATFEKLDGLLHEPYFQIKEEREKYLKTVLEWLSERSEGESSNLEFFSLKSSKETTPEATATAVKEESTEAKDAKVEDTTTEEAKGETPAADEVKAEEPAAEKSATEEPATEEPTVEEPKAEEPKVEEPKVEEPKVEEPTVEEPKAEEPTVEEPKVEEPTVEEPTVEEPKAEEPTVEEPKVEEPADTETPKEETPSKESEEETESSPEPTNGASTSVTTDEPTKESEAAATPKKKKNNKNKKKKASKKK